MIMNCKLLVICIVHVLVQYMYFACTVQCHVFCLYSICIYFACTLYSSCGCTVCIMIMVRPIGLCTIILFLCNMHGASILIPYILPSEPINESW